MKLVDSLKLAEKSLSEASINSARLDALMLHEYSLKKDRAWLLANPTTILSSAQIKLLKKILDQRIQQIPIAYIISSVEFYGRSFYVNSSVLVPRSETEDMIDLLKSIKLQATFKQSNHPSVNKIHRVADIGTGSGVVGITAKLEVPDYEVDLVDISAKALKVASTNVDKFTLSVNTIEDDLISNSQKHYDILLCNLPYVPDKYSINTAATHEPKLAIFGGLDGLNLYRRLFKQIQIKTYKPLYLLTEAMPFQHLKISLIALKYGYVLDNTIGYIQQFRYVNKNL